MVRRTSRGRRRFRALVASVVGLAVIAGLVGAALYGWHQLTRHTVTADSCQVVGESTGTVYSMDPEQLENASTISGVAMRRSLPQQAVIIALATAQQESKLRNLDYGDADSLGLFQQRPSQGWGAATQITQPVYAAGKFFDALLKVPDWQRLPVGDAAQDVQRSAFPQAYASWEPRATALAAALTGTSASQLTCRLVHPGIAEAEAAASAAASGESIATPVSTGVTATAGPVVDPTSASAAVTNGLRADLLITSPSVATIDSRTRTVTVSGLSATGAGGDSAAAHRASSVAAWAVAHAAPDAILEVVVGNQEWRPDKNGWHPTKSAAPAGHVVITVGSN